MKQYSFSLERSYHSIIEDEHTHYDDDDDDDMIIALKFLKEIEKRRGVEEM